MPRILIRTAVALGVLLLLILAAIGVVGLIVRIDHQRREAEITSFYDPPSPLPAGTPGAVIRTEPLEDVPDGINAWRILYHSTTRAGQDIAVSGMVAVPSGTPPAGGFPVLTLAHGTVGMARPCAPSLRPFMSRSALPSFLTPGRSSPSFFEQMLQPFTDAGYAVVATDYLGLGTPGINPYLVGEDAARNVLDAARALRSLPSLSLSGDTFIWGHSEGGQSALFAGQIAPRYASEMRILGVVAGSPAAQLESLAAELEGIRGRSPLTGLAVMIVRGWSAAYPNADPATVLTRRGLRAMPLVERECIGGVLLAFAFQPITNFLNPQALRTQPWAELIVANTAGAVRTAPPIRIFQGGADPLIKPAFTETLAAQLCAVGDTVALQVYPGDGHLSVITPSMPDTLTWMADRLAGRPAPSTCSGGG